MLLMRGYRLQIKAEFPRLEITGNPSAAPPKRHLLFPSKRLHQDVEALRKATRTAWDNSQQPFLLPLPARREGCGGNAFTPSRLSSSSCSTCCRVEEERTAVCEMQL